MRFIALPFQNTPCREYFHALFSDWKNIQKFKKNSNRLQSFHARVIKCIKKVQMIYKITKTPLYFETQATQKCIGGEKV